MSTLDEQITWLRAKIETCDAVKALARLPTTPSEAMAKEIYQSLHRLKGLDK